MEKPLPFPPDVKIALDEFHSWGGVVEHVLFTTPDVVDEHTHERAAKSGLLNIIEDVQKQTPSWKLTVDLSKLEAVRAEKQTSQQFLGEHFDVATRKPLFQFSYSRFLHPYDDEENACLRRNYLVEPEYGPRGEWILGYARAILDPPHSLGYSTFRWKNNKRTLLQTKIGRSFLELCDALFGDLAQLEIYSWPTDCSNYFEPGHEWWGSSFWTVYAPSKNWIVVILASSTD